MCTSLAAICLSFGLMNAATADGPSAPTATPAVAPVLAPARPQWEYKLLTNHELAEFGNKDFGVGLNKMGDDGWELLMVHDGRFVFKRAKVQAADADAEKKRQLERKLRLDRAQSDLQQWQDREAWTARMLQKGFVTAAQLEQAKAEVRRLEIELELLKLDLKKAEKVKPQ